MKARRHKNLKERLAFRKVNKASPKQQPDSNQMAKLLKSLDEKVDQLGEEIRQRDCKMVAINPQAINEQQAQPVYAQAERVQNAQVQSLIDLGPALEQSLIDFELESVPASEVHQGGRWYLLSKGHKAHFENIMPHRSSPDQWAVTHGSDGMLNIIKDPDREEPTESKWKIMTDLEEISNSSDDRYREEFLDQDMPVERSLENQRPDKALEMELRNNKGRKR